jgi:hypothetical protein
MSTAQNARNPEMVRLIRQLGCRSSQQRQQAQEALVACGQDAVCPLLEAWYALSPRHNPPRFSNKTVMLVTGGFLYGGSLILVAKHSEVILALYAINLVLLGIVLVTGPIGWLWSRLTNRDTAAQRGGIAAVAARLAGKRQINILVEQFQYELVHSEAWGLPAPSVSMGRLTRALIELQPSDVAVLTPASRAFLVGWLKRYARKPDVRYRDVDLVVAVLRGLSTIGASEVRADAERLAAAASRKPNGRRVREEAQRALEHLNDWGDREREGAILLRGSEPPVEDAAILVRPAGQREIAPELLLRGVDRGALKPESLRETTLETVLATGEQSRH